jgi:ceramide glucosyltransferase
MNALEDFLLAVAAASAAVYLLMAGGFLWAMGTAVPAPMPKRRPRVSIMKPLAGVDDELEENLASFARLDYPDYEIVLGVASVEDAAYPVARRFVEKFGHDRARLLVTDPDAATNPKVAQLLSLERACRGEIVVVSDSNVRVTPTYLDPLVAELARPGVAAVSSVVAGTGEQTLGAALENLQLGALIAPAVVASARIAGRAITIGKSMAMWREPLRQVGGFTRVAHLLSEDHMLGKAFTQSGYKVRVSLSPVQNRNVTCSLRRTIERHTRWAKLRRAIEPVGFWFEPMLSPMVMTTIGCAILPSRALALAFVSAVVLQTMGAVITTRVLRGSAPRWYWVPLEIVRGYLLFLCWLRACTSKRVSWRGHDFELARESAIVPAEPSVWHRVRSLVRA